MKKKILVISLLLVVISIIAFLGISISNGLKEKEKFSNKTPLPHFEFYTLDDRTFTFKDVKQGFPVLINYFSPTCQDCVWETEHIIDKINLFDNEQIIMVTYEKSPELLEFMEHFKLDSYPQIIVLYHKNNDFMDLFGSGITPSHFVYDSDHKLVEYFKGGAKMSLIKKKMYE